MRMVLLAHNLRVGGGHVVGMNFIKSLKSVGAEHKFFVIVPAGVGYEELDLPEESEKYVYQGGKGLFERWKFDTYQLPKTIREFSPDVILGLGNLGTTSDSYKQAIVFHYPRAIYSSRHYANESSKYKVMNWVLKNRIAQCLKYTQLVFCQTPVARERFSQVFKYPTDKIKIMPNAVSKFVQIDKKKAGVPEVLRRTGYYNLFFLTKYYAHKNLEVLIDIFKDHRELLHDVRCIITVAESQHRNVHKLLKNVDKYNLQEHILNVGVLKQEELAGYYYNCDALLFPTLLESFSGTYLEAMHFGVPIVTSDLDFAHYICKDAALYFNPWSASDIADKILLLKNNPRLRDRLIEKGKNQVATISKSWNELVSDVMRELERFG